jgi:hypothetical protein
MELNEELNCVKLMTSETLRQMTPWTLMLNMAKSVSDLFQLIKCPAVGPFAQLSKTANLLPLNLICFESLFCSRNNIFIAGIWTFYVTT